MHATISIGLRCWGGKALCFLVWVLPDKFLLPSASSHSTTQQNPNKQREQPGFALNPQPGDAHMVFTCRLNGISPSHGPMRLVQDGNHHLVRPG